MQLRTIEPATTKTAAYTASEGLDISGLTAADFNVIKIRVTNLKPTSGAGPKKARLALQHVAAADFTTPKTGPTFNVTGDIDPKSEVFLSVPAREYPLLPVGTINGKVRVALTEIDTNATITFEAWME